MPFLTDDDYKTLIKTDILAIVTRQDPTVRTTAERIAQSQIESYLRHKYDVAATFGKTGTDRAPDLVMYMMDIVLYHIHSAVSPQQIPDLRVKRYDDAIEWLKAVASGKLSADLPLLPAPEPQTTGGLLWGSQDRVNNYY
jgi:phage gp36-like protein